MAKTVKNLPARPGFDLWIKKIPWRREWLPIPVFLPRDFYGQKNLVGYSPWGCRVRCDWVTNTFTFIVDLQCCVSFKCTPRLFIYAYAAAAAKSLQSCLTLCNPMDYSPPGFSVHEILQAKILVWAAILQGIFPTQRSNPGFPHGRQILYCLSHQGSPIG